jgi:hypothetical protein
VTQRSQGPSPPCTPYKSSTPAVARSQRSQGKRPPAHAGGRFLLVKATSLVALSQFCSNTSFTDVQDDAEVTKGRPRVLSRLPQRRRITARLHVEVIEHYERGMSSRRVAATLGLGRTTVLEIIKAAGITLRPRRRKYQGSRSLRSSIMSCRSCCASGMSSSRESGSALPPGWVPNKLKCAQHDACGANRDRVHGGEASGVMVG